MNLIRLHKNVVFFWTATISKKYKENYGYIVWHANKS